MSSSIPPYKVSHVIADTFHIVHLDSFTDYYFIFVAYTADLQHFSKVLLTLDRSCTRWRFPDTDSHEHLGVLLQQHVLILPALSMSFYSTFSGHPFVFGLL